MYSQTASDTGSIDTRLWGGGKYISYLHQWATDHEDPAYLGQSPACYDEWLNNDFGDSCDFVIKNGVLIKYNGSGGDVTIPDSVTTIGDEAFDSCTSLTNITIPNSVVTIGDWAFQHCASLTSIVIPDNVTTIGDYAFYDCVSLTSVTVGNSVTAIGEYAFNHCTTLTNVVLGPNVSTIDHCAFYDCSSLTHVAGLNKAINLGNNVFKNCPLTDAPDTIKKTHIFG